MFQKLNNGGIINLKRAVKVSQDTVFPERVNYLLYTTEVVLDKYDDENKAKEAVKAITDENFVDAGDIKINKNYVKDVKIDAVNELKVEYKIFGIAPTKVVYDNAEAAKTALDKIKKDLSEGDIPVPPVDPEITSITVSSELGLTEPVNANAKVASLSAEGGTPELTYTLAGGKDDAKFQIKGTEVQAKAELTKGEYTIKVKVTDTKGKEKTSDDATISVAYNIKDVAEVFKVRGDDEYTFNKQIKELQENIAYVNTGKGTGKVTGNIKWITGYTNPAYQEGNVISIHIDNTQLPKGTIKLVWGTTEADPDTKDWNVNLKLNGKDDKTFKIKVNNDIVYTMDLSQLTLEGKDPEITNATVDFPKGLKVGDPQTKAKAKIADINVEGGTPPYLTLFTGGDSDALTVASTEIFVGNNDLTEKTYQVKIKICDSKQKDYDYSGEFTVSAQEE